MVLVRNPFLYLLIIFFLVTGFQYFYSGNTLLDERKINYTGTGKEITAGNVKELKPISQMVASLKCLVFAKEI